MARSLAGGEVVPFWAFSPNMLASKMEGEGGENWMSLATLFRSILQSLLSGVRTFSKDGTRELTQPRNHIGTPTERSSRRRCRWKEETKETTFVWTTAALP